MVASRVFAYPLIALMVLTRFHHFGDVLHLPDASLTVFFFAVFTAKRHCSSSCWLWRD